MEAKIVGGEEIDIIAFPYVAALLVKCDTEAKLEFWKCGSSIVNQKLILTAGHCLYGCSVNSAVVAAVGHGNYEQGTLHSAHSFTLHEHYEDETVLYDIAMIRLSSTLKFSTTVNRIALMKNPPYEEVAQVAGWGFIDEKLQIETTKLKQMEQRVEKISTCQSYLGELPEGTLCATSGDENKYASGGDSGSPLVARDYIQIGLVSYKLEDSRSIIVYTDTGYFYNWIKKTSQILLCL